MIQVAAAIILNAQNEVLISLRKSGQHLSGFWEFPGGKLMDGENLEACVIREIKEEIGIDIKVLETFDEQTFNYPEKTVQLHFFRCQLLAGIPQAIEVEAIRWVSIPHLAHYQFAPANVAVLKKLSDFATQCSK